MQFYVEQQLKALPSGAILRVQVPQEHARNLNGRALSGGEEARLHAFRLSEDHKPIASISNLKGADLSFAKFRLDPKKH